MSPALGPAYDPLFAEICELLDGARRASGKAVNSIITVTYWEIGRRIVHEEQRGRRKADYGEQLIDQLAHDLTGRFGRGFSRTNVFQMRQFYLVYRTTVQTASGQLAEPGKVQTVSELSSLFPLSWSHYVRLLSVGDENARQFYEQEAFRGGWSVRQLDRQIATQFYDRSKTARRPLASKSVAGDEIIRMSTFVIRSFWSFSAQG
jgi:hypothetical protein